MDDSFGLPSGHTQIGIVMWFWLAYEIRKTWAWVAAAILASGIAFSRLYMGVHDVEDVAVGAVLGIASLLAYRWSFTAHFDWWRALAFPIRFAGLAFAVFIALLLWPGGPGASAAIAGFFLIWYAGYALDRQSIRYQPHPAWWRRAIISLAGITGVIMLFEVLTALQEQFAPESASLAVLNGAIVGGFIVVLIPILAQLLRLASRGRA